MKNPIRMRAEGLGLSMEKLAYRIGVDPSAVSAPLNGSRALPIALAQKLAPHLQSDTLSLLITNSLYRKSRGLENDKDDVFIRAGSAIFRNTKFGELAANTLSVIEATINQPNAAPSVIMKDNQAPSVILTDNQGEGDAIPPAPPVVLGKGRQ